MTTVWKAIIEKTSSFTDIYFVELLNIEGDIWNAVKDWLKNNIRTCLVNMKKSILAVISF